MRTAPPVHMACGRDARWASVVTVLAATAAATSAWWLVRRMGIPTAAGAAAAAAGLAVALFVADRFRRGTQRRLQWDGRTWLLDGVPGQVEVMIDLGGWMLVRFVTPSQAPGPWAGRLQWLPINLGLGGSAPHLCRAALHAEAGRPTGLWA
jgi:hypothetical protein